MYIILTGGLRDSSLYNVFSLILIFIFVLILAYFSAKITGKLQSNGLNKKANIKVIESYRLGGNKFISIVKIGENYYALGFGKDEITMIDKLDSEKLSLCDDSSYENKMSFKELLSRVGNKEENDNIDIK